MKESPSANYNPAQAKSYLNSLKSQVAGELGINLQQGYNGELTSRQAGSIGGAMVKKMIAAQEMQNNQME